jgi:hypothetical protein
MCCDNPIDLGCFTSCDGIVTNIASTCTQHYTVSYNFNGAVINYSFTDKGNGFVTIPSGFFNDSSSTTFAVYDNAGEQIGCFKAKISVGILKIESGDTLTSTIELNPELCVEGVPTSLQTIVTTIEFNDSSLLQNGATIEVIIDTELEDVGINPLSSGYTVDGNTLTITDIDEIEDNKITLQIFCVLNNCAQAYELTASLGCFTNLPTTTNLGTQTPSNTITNG